MSSHDIKSAERPPPDPLLVAIADYAADYQIDSADAACETARFCLMDTLACGFLGAQLPGLHEAHGPHRAGRTNERRLARAGHRL